MPEPMQIAPGLAIMGQPSRADIRALAEFGYRTILNNRPDGEEVGQLSAAEAEFEADRFGLAYIHLPVTIGTITRERVAIQASIIRVYPKPIIAHCRTGTRSYLLWATGQVLTGQNEPETLMAQAAEQGWVLKALPNLMARLKGA